MPRRIAAAAALTAFVLCLWIGGIQADNPFGTTISRALVAMLGTLAVGLVIGKMAQTMFNENLRAAEKKLKNSEMKSVANDR